MAYIFAELHAIMNGVVERQDIHDFYADTILPMRSFELKSAIVNKSGRLEVVINEQVSEVVFTFSLY